MSERRGGLRADPIASLGAEALDRRGRRNTASGVRGMHVTADGLVPADAWHEVGATGEPSFSNSWVNFGAGYATAAFRRDGEGNVWIKGFIKSGTIGAAVFTLPAGYRPAKEITFATISNDAIGRLTIQAAGGVLAWIGSNTWFSLQCAFAAEQ